MMTLHECAVALHGTSGKNLSIEQAEVTLQAFVESLAKPIADAAGSLHGLWKQESDWRFGLADGITARVNFSGPPKKEHLQAFVKVFTAMAESFVETPESKT